METGPWNKVSELFQEALAQAPENRAEFLRKACPDNAWLRNEVQSLLENASDDGSFLQSSPLAGAALCAGEKLGNFRIIEPLGKGGMGEVYRASDLRLKREVAIKVLPRNFGDSQEILARFEREARAASALNHPNIVCVYDVGREDGVAWIASELVEGESMRQALAKGPLPLHRAIEIAAQIADGLAAAHAAGLVHRDVKPENIMLARDGRVKILDFGVAKRRVSAAAAAAAGTVITSPGIVSGTVGYMSPEQMGGHPADPRSDLFSLGVVVFEMLAGKRPFAGDTFVSAMNAVLTDEPALLPAGVPSGVVKLVLHCLAKEPERRLQSAADFRFALQLVQESEKVLAPKGRKRGLALTALAGAVLLAAIGLLRMGRNMATPPQPDFRGTMRRLTWDSGLTTDGAISPDGKLAAYASDRGNQKNLDIYVQQIDSGGVVRLTDDPADDHDPTFSPDGSQVAFRSERGVGGIYASSALGGESRLLVPGGEHPRFSPDGLHLMYSREDEYGGLFVEAVSGGAAVQVSRGCSIAYPGAVWSSDSAHIRFAGTCEGRPGEWLGSIEGRAPAAIKIGFAFWEAHRPLLPESGDLGYDEWVQNPPRLLLPLAVGDSSFEAAVPVAPDGALLDPVQRLTFGPGRVSRGSAATGGRIVLSSFEQSSNVWKLGVNAAGRAAGSPEPVTTGPAENVWPSISRDGKSLAFIMRGSGILRLHVVDLHTGLQRTLLPTHDVLVLPIFNPAGDRIAYSRWYSEQGGEVGVDGGSAETLSANLFSDWSTQDDLLVCVRDSHSINIIEGARSTSSSAFLSDSQSSLWEGHFSNDGRWVTFQSAHAGRSKIYIVPFRKALVPKKDWIPITDGTHWDDKPNFSPDGRLIFFISDRDKHRCIWAQALTPDMHPDGNAFPVHHSHSVRPSLAGVSLADQQLGVGPGTLIFNQGDRTGNIWLLDPQ